MSPVCCGRGRWNKTFEGVARAAYLQPRWDLWAPAPVPHRVLLSFEVSNPVPSRPAAALRHATADAHSPITSNVTRFHCIGCRGGRGASATRAQTCRWLPTRRTPPSRSCRNGRARAYSCRRSATCRCAGGSASPNSLPHLRADCRLRLLRAAVVHARGSDGALVPLRYYVHASDVLKAELLHSLADHVCFQSGTRPGPAGRLRPLVGRVAFVRTS